MRVPVLRSMYGWMAKVAAVAMAFTAAPQALTLPYAKIANPLAPSGVDQMVRDSLTLHLSRVRVNQAGYRKMDVDSGMAKFYYYKPTAGALPVFTVIDTVTGKSVATGTLHDKNIKSSTKFGVKASNWAGLVSGGDSRYTMSTDKFGTSIPSSEVYEGTLPAGILTEGGYYRIVVGSDTSARFLVSDSVYSYVRDAVVKFFGINRSGDGPSWFHPGSHLKDGYLANPSAPGSYKGGWYDCGDHLKEPQTQGYVLATLATMAATLPDRDADDYGNNHATTTRVDGIPDMLNEAHFGAQFFLNSWKLNGYTTGPGKAVSVGGVKTGMITGVGDFGKDHGWWGRPENQDAMTEKGRGGYKERTLRSELGANTLGDVAAGLAILSKRWRIYDAAWADTALMAAKDMYAYAKAHQVVVSSPAYNGSGADKVNANLALAATALLWVTHDTMYLNDIAYNTTIGSHGATYSNTGSPQPMANSWLGGWMVMSNPNLTKGGANTDWANRHQMALYAFYKLILANPDSALVYGVKNEAERENLITHTIAGVVQNLSSISGGNGINIPLPAFGAGDGGGYAIRADSVWFKMYTQQEWVWNRYYIANAAELFFYYDITKDLEAGVAGTALTSVQYNRAQVKQLMIRMWDYELGVNPWDVSMLMGVGKKNFNHPHHRAANPEGRNTPGSSYKYSVPVGALYGGYDPTTRGANDSGFTDYWNDYNHTEVCSDAAATSVMAAVGLAKDVNLKVPPHATVKVVYVSDTLAQIQIELDKYGSVKVNYGTTQGSYTKTKSSDSTGVSFTLLIGGLTPATQYYFNVVSIDLAKNDTTQDHWLNPAPDGTPYSFTTKATGQGKANITGVKVCNVTSDSAEIMWYTPNGEYQSSICWNTSTPVATTTSGTTTCAMDADVQGYPTKFHYVKIGNLTERTTYYFQVASDGSDGVWDDNSGKFYKFTTPIKMADFGIYAVKYSWAGMPALAINVVNNESQGYDSLTLRVYVRSKDTLASTGHFIGQPPRNVPVRFVDAVQVRYDICQAYDGAGFNHPCSDTSWGVSPWGAAWDWGEMGSAVQLLPPVQMPETYDPKDSTYVYYFNLPLGPTKMVQGSRIRFDVIFADKQSDAKPLTDGESKKVNWIRGFIPDQPAFPDTGWFEQGSTGPEVWHTSFLKDWSFIAHTKASGDPVDYAGMPVVADQTSANALIDGLSTDVTLDPYITVYRKGDFVYGYSPSKIEQARKKTYWGVTVKLDAPFDDTSTSTVVLDRATSMIHVTGTADVYDKLTTGAKGVITDIWVNGVRLSASELAAAATQDASTGLWNLNIPVKLGIGGNTVDVTIFGGSGTCPDTATSCESGCAFYNATYFVQFTKGKSTASSIAVLDASNLAPFTADLVPDSSSIIVEVRDNDNNVNAKSKDAVKVTLRSTGGRDSMVVTLTETGDSTGVFRSAPIAITSSGAWSATSIAPYDTLVARYIDANDSEDSSMTQLHVKSLWPVPLRGAIYRNCDGTYEARVTFDRTLGASGSEYVLNGGFESPSLNTKPVLSCASSGLDAWTLSNVDIVNTTYLSSASGNQSLDLNMLSNGEISQVLATSAGTSLVLSYAWSVNTTTGAPSDIEAEVLWNGTPIDTIRGSGTAARVWTVATKSLIAKGKDVLGFRSLTNGSFGIMLDNVSVHEPGVVALGTDSVLLRNADGDSDTVVAAGTATSLDASGKILSIPLSGIVNDPSQTGRAILAVPDGRGNYKRAIQALVDSVGPWIDSAKIVENLSSNPHDTLQFWASENVYLPARGWFLNVRRAGASVTTTSAVVDSVWLADTAARRFVLVFDGGTVKSGDSVSFASNVIDYAKNAPWSCQLEKNVGLLARSVPISGALLKDSDGDGLADYLQVTFVRKLETAKQEIPDSFVVAFGTGDTVRVARPSDWNTSDDSVFTVHLSVPFPASATTGSATGGRGKLWAPHKGASVDWSAPDFLIGDSVGPNAVSARLRYGDSMDTLLVVTTESVKAVDAADLIRRLRGDVSLGGGSVSGDTVRIAVPAGTLVSLTDSVRIGNGLSDAYENFSGAKNPAVVVRGGDRPPTYAIYQDLNGDGTIDAVELHLTKALRNQPVFIFRWPNRNGVLVSDTVAISATETDTVIVLPLTGMDALVTGIDTTRFPTRTLGTMLDTAMGDVYSFSVRDGAAPVLVSAVLHYSAEDAGFDTLTLKFSESVNIGGFGKVAVVDRISNLVRYVSFLQTSDSTVALYLDTSISLSLNTGDSLAIAPLASGGTITDHLGNSASVVGRWVHLVIGPMKSVFSVTVVNPIQIYTGWLDGKASSGSPLQILVQDRDSTWQQLDGTPAVGSQGELVDQGMGVKIRANDAFGGFAYIYDNLGTFVAKIDLSEVAKQWGELPKFGKGYSQIWLRWSGYTSTGAVATSGVYSLRLVTRRSNGTSAVDAVNGHFINQLYKMGWKRKN